MDNILTSWNRKSTVIMIFNNISFSDLEELCHYSGLLQKRQLQYATKQLLAREVSYMQAIVFVGSY